MLTRRSLFRRFGALVAVVALAPEIAFRYTLRVKPELANPTPYAGAIYFNSSNGDMYVNDGHGWLPIVETT